MKKLLQIPLLLVALFLTSIPISAHDFEVDGIFYNILSDSTVEVTYKGSEYSSYNEYSGSISIPSTVTYNSTIYTITSIGDDAFRKSGLSSIDISQSVVKIGSGAFFYCRLLETINIPYINSINEIGHSAFVGSGWYENQEDGILYYNMRTKANGLLLSKNFCLGYKGINKPVGPLTLLENTCLIANLAFSECTGLTGELKIPNSVTKIGGSAFSGCRGLTSVTIPNSVTEIGYEAFSNCTGLTEVNISDLSAWCKIDFESNRSNPIFYAKKLKLNGAEITNLVIPNDITQIKGYAFYGCSGLASVAIPNSVTTIGSSAFHGCTGLTSVTIPNSVTSIGESAFYGCTGLTELTIEDGTDTLALSKTLFFDCPFEKLYLGRNLSYESSSYYDSPLFNKKETLKSVTIGNFVTSIGDYLFSHCDGLTSVTIPNSVTNIGKYAFYDCTGLTSVTIGNSVTTIGDWAFYWCQGLTSVSIPNSTTEIGSSAFFGCSGLKEVNITDLSAWCKIDFDDEYANPLTYARKLILNGSQITNLAIPNDITEIKKYTFSGCRCSSLVIGRSVISIGFNAFRYSSLTNISLPNSLTSISYGAFAYCNNLISCGRQVSQTAITITQLSTPTQYTPYFNCNGNSYSVANKITGLTPNTKYYYSYGLIINGISCQINSLSFTTSPFNVTLTGTAGVATLSANGSYTQGDATFVGQGLNLGSEVTNFDNKNNVTFENLDPNTSYTVYYGVKIKESSSTYTTSETFTTEALNWANGRYDATSTTSARLIVETNCDATLGTGYEWRRIDAPDIIASSKVECPVVNGMLVGSLRNLNPDVYYKCRPYYTSASGNTYYGDWVGFYTADANVYFSPEVLTYSNVAVNNNSAVVKGYALEGTDVITAQGFEYWKTGTTIKPASTDDRKVVNASGIVMSATLTNLDYNSTYKYCAFVTTEKGTVYGDEIEFSTGDDPAGIGYIEIDSDELTVTLRENPATGTAWVKIAGATGGEAQYAITSMSGSMVACGRVMLEDEWNAIELDCPSGLYLLTINDGKQVKTLRLIVK